MKKLLINRRLAAFMFLLGTCLTVLIIGCSQQNDVDDQTSLDNTAYNELLSSLETKSNEFFNSHPPTNTRFGFFLKRVWNTVKADVEATYKASIGEDGMTFTERVLTASKKAFHRLESVKVSYENGSPKTRNVIDSLLIRYTAVPGNYTLAKAHNMVILKMYKEDFNDSGLTVNTIAKARSILLANNLSIESCTIEESARIVDDFLIEFLSTVDNNSNEEPSQSPYVQGPGRDNPKAIIDTYLINVSQYTNMEDISAYTTLYQQEILKSNLDFLTQKRLVECIKLGEASFDLWSHIVTLE